MLLKNFWHGVPVHPSMLVRNYETATKGRIVVERRLACVPKLNPFEYTGTGELKTHEFTNLIRDKARQHSFEATAALRQIRYRRLIISPVAPRPNYGRNIALLFETQ